MQKIRLIPGISLKVPTVSDFIQFCGSSLSNCLKLFITKLPLQMHSGQVVEA